MKLLVKWLLSAIALMIVAYLLRPGFYIRNFWDALIAAAVIGFINATVGAMLRVVTFPLTLLTLGLFLIIINAILLKIAAFFSPGFQVRTWFAAIVGAILLSIVTSVLHWLVGNGRRREQE